MPASTRGQGSFLPLNLEASGTAGPQRVPAKCSKGLRSCRAPGPRKDADPGTPQNRARGMQEGRSVGPERAPRDACHQLTLTRAGTPPLPAGITRFICPPSVGPHFPSGRGPLDLRRSPALTEHLLCAPGCLQGGRLSLGQAECRELPGLSLTGQSVRHRRESGLVLPHQVTPPLHPPPILTAWGPTRHVPAPHHRTCHLQVLPPDLPEIASALPLSCPDAIISCSHSAIPSHAVSLQSHSQSSPHSTPRHGYINDKLSHVVPDLKAMALRLKTQLFNMAQSPAWPGPSSPSARSPGPSYRGSSDSAGFLLPQGLCMCSEPFLEFSPRPPSLSLHLCTQVHSLHPAHLHTFNRTQAHHPPRGVLISVCDQAYSLGLSVDWHLPPLPYVYEGRAPAGLLPRHPQDVAHTHTASERPSSAPRRWDG